MHSTDHGNKAIITCAITGVLTDPGQHHVPVTPEQLAKEARRAYDAGAAMATAGATQELRLAFRAKILPELLGVDIHEGELRYGEFLLPLDEPLDQFRSIRASRADDADLQSIHDVLRPPISILLSPRCADGSCRRARPTHANRLFVRQVDPSSPREYLIIECRTPPSGDY